MVYRGVATAPQPCRVAERNSERTRVMIDELMRLAFLRRATYVWFVIVFVGFLIRPDTFGVTSIIRAREIGQFEHSPYSRALPSTFSNRSIASAMAHRRRCSAAMSSVMSHWLLTSSSGTTASCRAS